MKSVLKTNIKVFALLIFIVPGIAFSQNWKDHLSNRLSNYSERLKNFAADNIKKNKGLMKTAVRELIQSRCNYFSQLMEPITHYYCDRSANRLVNLLDINITELDFGDGELYYLPTVFETDLLDLIKDSKITPKVLYSIYQQFENNLTSGSNGAGFDLWQTVFSHTGNEEDAIKFIAVLFQDTSEAQTTLYFLDTYIKNNNIQDQTILRNVQMLEEIHQQFVVYQDLYKKPENIKFYPHQAEFKQILKNLGLYHFYVPAYLTIMLRNKKYSQLMSVYAPFTFNYIYEIFTSDDAGAKLLFFEPKKVASAYKRNDIFLAYFGSMFGVGQVSNMVDEGSFLTLLENDPRRLIRTVIKGLKSLD